MKVDMIVLMYASNILYRWKNSRLPGKYMQAKTKWEKIIIKGKVDTTMSQLAGRIIN
jgi:hypothetical protein